MPLYKYKALTSAGITIEGTHAANRKEEIIAMMRQGDQYPVLIEEVLAEGREISFFDIFNKIKTKDISVFCRQFYTMLNAGVSIINCLDILKLQTENKKFRVIIGSLFDEVQKGMTFSEAMKKYPDVFPELMINMVAVGEVSGNLDVIMDRMAVHYEKENKVIAKVKGAMIYPAVLACVATGVVIFLLTFVMPTFVTMFESGGVALPLPTRILLSLSSLLVHYGVVVFLVLAALIYYLRFLLKTDRGKLAWDRMMLKLPIVKGTTQKIVTARFTRTLATLMASGIPLIQAIEVISRIVGNKVVEKELVQAIEDVKKGVNLSVPIRNMKIFPPMVSYMVSIGEESGSLDDIMNRTANYYDDEVEIALQKLTALMEPLMILVMAVVVGGIAIAMVMPMFDMMNAVNM